MHNKVQSDKENFLPQSSFLLLRLLMWESEAEHVNNYYCQVDANIG